MATITDLGAADSGSTSRATINTNFDNLNTDKVETSVTINSKPLSGNITLAAADFADVVPTTRTVNGKALSGNITLGLASSDYANQGTTTTVLHGNAAGNPAFGAVVEADITLADNTTNDVSATKHGFAPKIPNNTTTFLRGDGTYATPSASTATLAASNTLQESADTEQSTTSTTDVKKKEIIVHYSGTIRVKMDLRGGSAGDGVIGTVYVNGVAAASAHNNETSGALTYSDDITVNIGDLVQGYLRKQTSGTAYISNFRIYADKTSVNLGLISLN